MAERKPLSLNERHQLLIQDLSRNRHSNAPPPPDEVRKVKVEGRRRLCKASSASSSAVDDNPSFVDLLDSPTPPPRKDDAVVSGESVIDILNDLTSRLDALSVEKQPKHRSYRNLGCDEENASRIFTNVDNDESDLDDCAILGANFKQSVKEDDCVRSGNQKDEDEAAAVAGIREQLCNHEEDDDETENHVVECLSDDNDGGVDEGDAIRLESTTQKKAYVLPGNIAKMLYPHQREGLEWLWDLHCRGTGGILGDDMGLGKTMQISAFLAGLFHSVIIKRALIVAPKTLIGHWIKELTVVGLSEKIRDYSGASAKLRQYELNVVLEDGGVLLTTYDIVRNNSKLIKGNCYLHADSNEEAAIWDYTVLDEGHIIKNPKTQRAQSLLDIPSSYRIIVSGTPIQNNLKELWALFNFCCPGLLGDTNEFKVRYEHAILRGNEKNASNREMLIGSTAAKELRERIKPYFLRRMKNEVFQEDESKNSTSLSKKNEIIVWLKLTPCQRQLYEAFLKSEWVHSAIQGSPLAALTILKKICDHPLLLTKKAAEGVLEGMDSTLNSEELGMVEKMAMNLANVTYDVDDGAVEFDHNVSCKISFLISLLENLVEEGHTVLIFSQTRKMLNLIQEAIAFIGYQFLRIDGTTKLSDREKIVKDFQEGNGAPIFLLTSQVGGLGLTLTKADRVIVVDPAWNPSTDSQSVDRAYRIGQKNDVLVYRLMTCGTIEEKIYKMQVFKGGLIKTATEQKEQTRYFSQKDIRELFSIPEQGFDVSLTQKQLYEEHDQQNVMDVQLMKHIRFLEQQSIAGVSFHSLLFSKASTMTFGVENIEVQCKPLNARITKPSSHSSTELGVDASEFSFKPKDAAVDSRRNLLKIDEVHISPEQIEDRIKRLSHTLANKALVSKLPDRGDKIQRQIIDLTSQLHIVKNKELNLPRKEAEVIDLDDLTEELKQACICSS